MLLQAGIRSNSQLQALGAVEAYVRVKKFGNNASLNLLWALEGALSGRSWREVAKTERLRLLIDLEDRTKVQKSKVTKPRRSKETE